MADSTDALLEIVYELTVTHNVRLAPTTLRACRGIFDQTVANFASQAADQAVAEHPWDNDDFRAFILGQVRRIAEKASALAGSGPVSPEVLRQAAFEVMSRTNRVCRLAAERGRLKFATAEVSDQYEGQVCSMYLQNAEL
jgi:hypothetical protein